MNSDPFFDSHKFDFTQANPQKGKKEFFDSFIGAIIVVSAFIGGVIFTNIFNSISDTKNYVSTHYEDYAKKHPVQVIKNPEEEFLIQYSEQLRKELKEHKNQLNQLNETNNIHIQKLEELKKLNDSSEKKIKPIHSSKIEQNYKNEQYNQLLTEALASTFSLNNSSHSNNENIKITQQKLMNNLIQTTIQARNQTIIIKQPSSN